MEKSWYQIIQGELETKISDAELKVAQMHYTHLPPPTKEALYYRRIFEQHFEKKSATDKFLEVKSSVIPYYWLPKWCGNIMEPSARVLPLYSKSHGVTLRATLS